MRNAARLALLVAVAVVAACGGGDGGGPSDPVPTSIAISAGNNQTGPVATALAIAPAAIVKDQRGNGIPGITVTFAVQSGGGTVGGAQVLTDQGGIARVGSWILGTATGTNTLSATVQGLTPITFTATATAGPAAALVFITAPASTSANGAILAPAPSVQVKDQFGNNRAQAGYTVTVAIATGGGVLGGTTTVATNASGVATFANLTLTGTVGARTLSFSGTGVPALLSGAIQLTSGTPATLAAATPTTLAGTVGAAVGSAVTVTATDQSGNPVAGAQVTFAVTAGGGGITGATQTTDAAGQATLGSWTLGTTAGILNTVSATLGALPPVVFSSTPVAGAASQILIVTQPGTTAAVNGAPLSPQPTIQIADQFGNPVAQVVSVTAAIASGGGTLNGTTTLNTAADGSLSFSNLAVVGLNGLRTLGFSAAGLTSATSAGFTTTSGPATTMAVSAGDGQSATVGSAVAIPPAVLITDQSSNPVAGVSVSFGIATGGGSVSGGAASSAANGVAAVGSWTLGTTAGTNTLTATAAGLTGSPITFTATGTPAPASALSLETAPSNTATNGVALAQQPAVQLRDQFGNAVSQTGVVITASIGSGGGNVAGNITATTNAGGLATFSGLIVNGLVGTPQVLSFSGSGLTAVVSGNITMVAGAAAQLQITTQPSSSAQNGVALAQQPVLQVTDAGGNPVAIAINVTAAIGSGGGSLGGTTTVLSSAGGVATFTNLAITGLVGNRTLVFSASGLTGTTSGTITLTAGAATTIAASSTTSQSATVGTAVATPPAVLVTDQSGNPVGGISVTFAVASGGGSVAGGAATTAANGIAVVGSWTLGNALGANSVTATSTGLAGSPVTFTATGTAGAPANVSINAGDGQSATVGTAVAIAPSVAVTDQFGNPASGVTVTFAVTGGGGSIIGATPLTDAGGIATLGSWTLGTLAGANTLSATVVGVPAVNFTATGTAGAASTLAVSAGNGQTATVNTAVAVAPAVLVTDQFGNPVSGIAVTFAVASGGGSVTGAAAVSNAGGIATVGSWTLGTVSGGNTLSATAAGLSGSPATFTATGTAGAATTMALNGGDGQSAVVGTAVSTDPSVLITDQFGNGVAGVSVTFAVASGNGSVTGGTALSNAAGVATVGSWTLGNTAGANTLTATSAGLTGSPVTFAATAVPAAASQLVITTQPSANATNGVVLAQQPAVQLRDAFGNDVAQAGVTVTAAVASGSGTATGSTTAITSASGLATFAGLSLTGLVGNYTLALSASGLTSATTSSIALAAGAAATIALNAGNNQTAAAGTAVAIAPSVVVQDGSGNAVSGVAVTFAVTGGGGSVTGAAAVSNAGGIATVGSWTLGTTAGANSLSATSAGLAGSPVGFTATGTAGAATDITVNAGDNQTGTVGAALATALSVLVTDNFGNPVSGFTVTWATPSGGSLPASSQTNASGIASATWTLGTAAGGQSATATGAGLSGSPVAFSATAQPGAATAITKTAGDNQTATVNSSVAVDPAVQVTDQFSNPVPGVTVTFAVTSGGGSVTGGTQITDGGGLASVGSWTLGTGAGSNTLSATVSGVPAASFTATGAADAATTIAASAGNGQTATVNTAVAVNPEVLVTDQFGNPVSGVVVNFSVTGGAGSIAGASGTTDGLGHATGGSWTLGQTAGANTLEATSGVLVGSPVTFTATGTAAPATKLTITTQPSANAVNGAVLGQQPVLQLRDAFNNAVSQAGVSVTASASAGGTLSGTVSASTSAGGQASFTNLALSGLVGNYTLSFNATGLTGATSTSIALGAGAATSIVLNAGDGQTAAAGTAVAILPSVQVRDGSGNGVSGVSVTFAVSGGGGSLTGAAAVSDVSGIATVGSWTLGTVPGPNSLTATSTGLSGSPVTFTATGVAGPAASVIAQSATAQNGRVGIAATALPSVLVRDQFNNPVPGASVTFAVTAGGGSVTGGAATTDGLGLATVTSWTFGKTVLTNTVTATVGALPVVSFDATVTFEVASVAGGSGHTCALTIDSVAYCWGENGSGAVGDSTITGPRLGPVPVSSAVAFSQLGLGTAHSCGVSSSNAALCWGDNSQRQLGDGTNASHRIAPVSVAAGTYTRIEGGFDHTCAIEAAGTLRCWGANSQGQLGRTGAGPFNLPQPVTSGFTYTDVSTGTFFTCAVRTTGAAYCWGDNAFGQLGDSTKVDKNSPTAVKGGLLFSQIAVGQVHACGLTTGGLVYCWGDNTSGRIGQDPGLVSDTTTPIQVAGLSGIVQLAAGEAHTCARDPSNSVFCWGLNQVGQLGDGNSGSGVFSFTPVAVVLPGGAGFTSITAGSQSTCGVTATNTLYCWGEGSLGQLGDGTGLDQPLPTQVINP